MCVVVVVVVVLVGLGGVVRIVFPLYCPEDLLALHRVVVLVEVDS